MTKINVLVFPAEGNNAVELHNALATCVNIKLFGATSVKRHGRYIYANLIEDIPNISDNRFIDEFNSVLDANAIDVVFPTHDSVALYLAKNRSKIRSKLVLGSLETAEICRSKIKTYELFQNESFMPKRVYEFSDAENLPLFSKPDEGEGSKGACKINTVEELKRIDFSNHLITEYLPGREYTIDCFTNYNGELQYFSVRSRDRLSAGVSVSGVTIKELEPFRTVANIINSKLNFIGLWYFQMREDNFGNPKLMEISTRCAGTMCHTRARGINLPLLSVYTVMGYEVSCQDNDYVVEMDRALIGRYNISYIYDNVYIDFDDTITHNGTVNTEVIKYLFQCKNNKKRIILLTRHGNDILRSLNKFCIHENMFDEIIQIMDGKCKSEYINPEKSIFIDNAYNERADVAKVHNIPVFDVDQVEFLIDWRL